MIITQASTHILIVNILQVEKSLQFVLLYVQ